MSLSTGNNGKKVKINAVIEAVSLVPAKTVDSLCQLLRLLSVCHSALAPSKSLGYPCHCQKLTVHKRIEQYRSTALCRTVEAAGVVVNALSAIVKPEIQTAGMQTFSVVILDELLDPVKMGTYPVISRIRILANEGYVLCKHRLMYVGQLIFRRGVNSDGGYKDRQSAVLLSVHKKVEDTARSVFRYINVNSVIFKKLSEGNVCEETVPVPKRSLVCAATGHDVGIPQISLCPSEHTAVLSQHIFVYKLFLCIHTSSVFCT